jgi:hypothetical protein
VRTFSDNVVIASMKTDPTHCAVTKYIEENGKIVFESVMQGFFSQSLTFLQTEVKKDVVGSWSLLKVTMACVR